MKVWVQGKEKEISRGLTLESLLSELGLEQRFLATAVNEVIVSRVRRSEFVLTEGDRVEILSPQQGG